MPDQRRVQPADERNEKELEHADDADRKLERCVDLEWMVTAADIAGQGEAADAHGIRRSLLGGGTSTSCEGGRLLDGSVARNE